VFSSALFEEVEIASLDEPALVIAVVIGTTRRVLYHAVAFILQLLGIEVPEVLVTGIATVDAMNGGRELLEGM